MPLWEYRVVHINVDSTPESGSSKGDSSTDTKPNAPASPQQASEHLHGVLSPSSIAREFPQHYSGSTGAKPKGTHPAEQLQQFLNQLGRDGWEMTTTAQVGPVLMFFFKRPVRALPKLIASSEQDDTLKAP
ncbi:hypothetical protein [Vulcanococcus sp. Clear-D1]|uniref:hypothetical protein n=1 Tax=Vulcanococcus sp. Clear-D1 TaxID=2766970 RepID=UPI001997C528|nr:hypothetical protein [Vulcanococcus sp. Clear-D1]MBD1193330.1 hypothetical protein [Vulcanococcus sp. Clear-D1]